MLVLLVWAIIAFFFLMGLVGLVTPDRIPAMQGQHAITPESRNEVRAVYGGFGVLVAAVLVWGRAVPAHRTGVLVAIAAAVAGMALGRLVAAALEPPRRFYPSWFYFVLEVSMAAILAAAAVAA